MGISLILQGRTLNLPQGLEKRTGAICPGAGHQGQDAFHHVVGDGEVGQVQGVASQVGHMSEQ
ncbi:MAG: hypothetical protein COS90_02265 [Deltaproteobacteria bacterium CG07_land_8_20_14_0_80_60_11]|nr:MAG: hypothetical protein COS90_02265 [Deltaproteobacteria bacterium CG07_land_8_20_14_0_80_60_11]